MLSALGGRHFYRVAFLSRGRFHVRRERLVLPPRAQALAGLCIVQLSDFHAGPFLGVQDLAAVFERVHGLAPDLVVLTGDYLTDSPEEALGLARQWPDLGARYGTLAVFGNHDYRQRREGEIASAFAARGVHVLRDQAVRIQHRGAVLAVVGLEDLEEARSVHLEAARAQLEPGDVEIVLCHHPRGASRLARPQCLAVLSGHTHAMQIGLPWISALGPAHPGRRVLLGSTTLIVNAGLGVIGVPVRVRARPEIVVLELQAQGTKEPA